MKKIYIAPSTVLKTVRAKQAMLAGSNTLNNNGEGTSVFNPGTMEEGNGSDAAARGWTRGGSVWDD